MIDRRTLFGVTATMASVVTAAVTGRKASAKLSHDYQPRGVVGRLERIPKLDVESRDDYLMGFRTWVQQDLWRAGRRRTNKILEANGLDPRDDLPTEQIIDLVNNDPVVGMSVRTWMSCQKMTWQNFEEECHANADIYFDELEAADNAGPGTLELNPDMEIPDYTKHEIHIMPGGYVGDPFAGYIFHYGTNNFYTYGTTGLNFQDGVHINYANQVPEPADGKVLRILDMGCSIGQYSVALKERFPDAEVWGIDVGGPMVRYAHMRAADIGVDVNFAQRLAEDTKFPDGHFDIVTSYILHHEVTEEASKAILKEAYRVLRPGGVYYPNDVKTMTPLRPDSADQKVLWWWHHRWNQEAWLLEYIDMDYAGAMRDAGFEIEEGPPQIKGTPGGNLLGVKPV